MVYDSYLHVTFESRGNVKAKAIGKDGSVQNAIQSDSVEVF